jgi:hypothetical protein
LFHEPGVGLIARLNIDHLLGRFPELQDRTQMAYVKRLLVMEEDSFARASERVQLLSDAIEKVTQSVRTQQRFMPLLRDGPDAEQAKRLLENSVELRSFLERAREIAAREACTGGFDAEPHTSAHRFAFLWRKSDAAAPSYLE